MTGPTALFVAEGLLFPDLPRHPKVLSKSKLRSLLTSVPLDTRMAAHFWDIEWRTDMAVEHVTLLGERMADAMEERLTRDHVPGQMRWSEPIPLRSYIESDHVRLAIVADTLDIDLGPKATVLSDPDLFEF